MHGETFSKYWSVREPGEIIPGVRKLSPLPPGWSLVRVKKVGICGTDYNAFRGTQPFLTYPRILGHECAGEIKQTTDESGSIRIGDRVTVIPYIHCKSCVACREGKTNCCTKLEVIGVHRDGAMQQLIEVPNENIIVCHDLPLDHLATVEPLSIGAHAVSRAGLKSGETVAVVGAGPIGLGIMGMAHKQGVKIIAVDTVDHRLHTCLEWNVAQYTVSAKSDPLEEIKKITEGDLCAVVFDATGNRGAMEYGVHYLAHGGRYVLVGLTKENLTFSHPFLHAREISILCSRNATRSDFMEVIDTLGSAAFPVGKYISHHIPFERVAKDLPELSAVRGNVIKALIDYE